MALGLDRSEKLTFHEIKEAVHFPKTKGEDEKLRLTFWQYAASKSEISFQHIEHILPAYFNTLAGYCTYPARVLKR
jgi:hypothetical protein